MTLTAGQVCLPASDAIDHCTFSTLVPQQLKMSRMSVTASANVPNTLRMLTAPAHNHGMSQSC